MSSATSASSSSISSSPSPDPSPPTVTTTVTANGTFYVSQPYRSSSSSKLRAMISFAPRKSHFDISNEQSFSNEFRGFFSLFWVSMLIFAVRTYVRSIEANGYALELSFATMISRDAVTLALSDAVLVGSTALCVPFAKAIANGYIRYFYTGVIIQTFWQLLVLVTAVTWTFNRQWPWVQSGFLTLHSLTMIMKMHSYMATNGELQYIHTQAERALAALRAATDDEGGWDAALAAAEANIERASSAESGTPTIPDETGTTTSYVDARTAVTLRQRLAAQASCAEKASGTRVLPPSAALMPTQPPSPSEILAHHPSEHIAALARAHVELDRELVGTVEGRVRWPENITLKNFVVYQMIPTLVYELEYPRTERIRPLYVFEKTAAFLGTFALLYTVTESFILPLTPTRGQPFLDSLLDLALPFMMAYLLLFYIIFECICNGFAELSYFADRQFYDDWWNSTSWEEFSRKWNRPVHTFLLRHVYASSMSNYKLSRQSAMFLTFALSAAAHELVMAVVTKKIRFYLFAMQLAQLPLIAIGRIPAIRRNKLLGNIVFWVGLYSGFPLLCVAYCAY